MTSHICCPKFFYYSLFIDLGRNGCEHSTPSTDKYRQQSSSDEMGHTENGSETSLATAARTADTLPANEKSLDLFTWSQNLPAVPMQALMCGP
jgi:hypothetical protein